MLDSESSFFFDFSQLSKNSPTETEDFFELPMRLRRSSNTVRICFSTTSPLEAFSKARAICNASERLRVFVVTCFLVPSASAKHAVQYGEFLLFRIDAISFLVMANNANKMPTTQAIIICYQFYHRVFYPVADRGILRGERMGGDSNPR